MLSLKVAVQGPERVVTRAGTQKDYDYGPWVGPHTHPHTHEDPLLPSGQLGIKVQSSCPSRDELPHSELNCSRSSQISYNPLLNSISLFSFNHTNPSCELLGCISNGESVLHQVPFTESCSPSLKLIHPPRIFVHWRNFNLL